MKIYRHLIIALFLGTLFAGCSLSLSKSAQFFPEQRSSISLGKDLLVIPIAKDVFVHVSKLELPGMGLYPSNGLIIIKPRGAILIDTAWTNDQTRRLIEWVRYAFKVKVRELIITHGHDDRMGGIDEAISLGVKTHSIQQTRELAIKTKRIPPQYTLPDQGTISILDEKIEIYYPGAGHSLDNIIVWIPSREILFGGCLIKALTSKNLGNTKEADLENWPKAIQKVIARYPSAKVVIPGHGEIGNIKLLHHTLGLLK